MKKIKRVATFDADDTLLNTQQQMTKFVNRTMGLAITDDFWVHENFAELFGISKEEGRKLARDFHASPEFEDVVPHPGVVEAMEEFDIVYDELHVSTARPSHLHAMTGPYLRHHFGTIFSGIHFSNKYEDHLPKQSKADVGRRLGAEDHYEDVVSHILDCSTAYRRVFAVEFPWNKHVVTFPDNVHRVKHIREALPIVWRHR